MISNRKLREKLKLDVELNRALNAYYEGRISKQPVFTKLIHFIISVNNLIPDNVEEKDNR